MTHLVRRIILSASSDIEIERGVVLPAGNYAGFEGQVGVELVDRTRWREPEYKIEITADQIKRIGTSNATNLLPTVYDVTQFVRLGVLTVTKAHQHATTPGETNATRQDTGLAHASSNIR
jgi:hypothetical protein